LNSLAHRYDYPNEESKSSLHKTSYDD